MARIFLDGFESGGLDQFTSSSGATVVSSSGLSMDGNYCLLLGADGKASINLSSSITELYLAFAYRPTGLSYYTNTVFSIWSVSTNLMQLKINDDGDFYAVANGLSGLSYPGFCTINQTYFFEVYYKLDNVSGRVVVKSNGVSLFDSSGDTNPGAYTGFNIVMFGKDTAPWATGNAYYDNIILDSANWIGKTYIQGLAVTGVGTTTQLTPSTGSNYTCVDEIPASDTDYVYSNTVDQLDTYTLADLTGTIGTIKAVQVQSRVVKEGSATPQNVKLAVRSGI